MKRYLLPILILLNNSVYSQTVLRVNNTPGVDVPYTTIAAAVTAAGPSDIIMVEGSLTDYGDITINKKVTIIGPGYFLTENLGFQAKSQGSALHSLTLNAVASGSSVTGLLIGDLTATSVTSLNISGCYLSNSIQMQGTGSNVFFQKNYISYLNFPGSYTSSIISNNFFIGYVSGSQIAFNSNSSSILTVNNNTFSGAADFIANSDVRNNIFLTPGEGFTGSVVKNNVFVGAQSGVDATNVTGVSAASLFVGLIGNTSDTQWKLKSGSPAIGFGEFGVDCGMYGGADPYRISGIRAGQPTITLISNPTSVPQNGVLSVKVNAKVN